MRAYALPRPQPSGAGLPQIPPGGAALLEVEEAPAEPLPPDANNAMQQMMGMLSGGGTMAVFYLIGYLVHDKFSAYELLSLHPFIWSVLVSAFVMLIATKGSSPTDPELVEKYFGNVGNKGGNI